MNLYSLEWSWKKNANNLYYAVEAGLDELAISLYNTGTVDIVELFDCACKSNSKYFITFCLDNHLTELGNVFAPAVYFQCKFACEYAIEKGINNWHYLLVYSALNSFRWGCELAILNGAGFRAWNILLIASSKASFEWGCKKAISRGGIY